MREARFESNNHDAVEITSYLSGYPEEFRKTRWYNPARGPKAEIHSLEYQHRAILDIQPPDNLQEVIERVASMYPKTKTGWVSGLNALFNSDVTAKILDSVNKQASPGYPWVQLAKKNIDLLGNDSAYMYDVCSEVRARLELLSTHSTDLQAKLHVDPLYAVRNGLCDPVRVFVKNEPHSERKAAVGRWRIICSVSLVDQLVEKYIYWAQDQAEKESWQRIPSKPGMGLDLDEDLDSLFRYARDNGLTRGSDASGFDISQPAFLVRAEQRVREMLAIDATPDWLAASRNFTECMLHKVLIASDGTAFIRKVPGGMASGRFVTATSNSRARGLIHTWCALRAEVEPGFMAMGDDCLERPTLPRTEMEGTVFENFGVKLTDLEDNSEDFSFCSHRFTTNSCVPENVEKLLVKYHSSQVKDFVGLEHSLLRHPDGGRLLAVARAAIRE